MQNVMRVDVNSALAYEPETAFAPTLPPSPLSLADGSQGDVASPALALQQRLLDELNAEAADDDGVRWSPRATLLFCTAVSAGLWGVIALAITAFR
jgi:hypothetical protein